MRVTLDTRPFVGYLEQLSASLKVSRAHVIRSETGSILKLWVLRTKTSKPAKLEYRGVREAVRIGRRMAYGGTGKASDLTPGQSWFTIGRGSTPTGRVWHWNKRADSFFLIAGPGATKPNTLNRYGSKTAFMQGVTRAEMPSRVKSAKQASGLSRQSVVQIGDALGIKIESVPGGRSASAAVAKARKAIASDGMVYQNGVGNEIIDEHRFFVRLVNRIPWGRSPRIQMDRTIAGILSGRIKYFAQNVAHGVFSDAAKIARAYPGIRVSFPPKIDAQ